MIKLQDEGFQVYVILGNFPTLGRYTPKSNELKGVWCLGVSVITFIRCVIWQRGFQRHGNLVGFLDKSEKFIWSIDKSIS